MSSREWSAEEVDYFVALYKSHECLWKLSNTLSMQKQREDAYADIKKKMMEEKNNNLEIVEIKEKLSSLQELFYKLKKQYDTCPTSEPRTKWYNDMEYIMVNYGGKQVDKTTEGSKTKPMVRKKETNSMLKRCKKTTSVEMIESDGGEKSKLDNGRLSSIKQSRRKTILEVLKKFYADKVAPNYQLIMDAITQKVSANDDFVTVDVNRLENIMNVLGFIEKETIDGRKIIIERADQRFERYNYFTKIKTARMAQNRQIVYIDERIIDSKLGFEKVYSQNYGLPDESTIYYHAFTRDGLLNGIFSNQATEEEFTKWVSSILMSYLKTPSLIIMDKVPLHGVLDDVEPVTRYSPKTEMLKWLIENNIPFNANMPRPVLFELIRKNRNDDTEYKIDKLFKSHGHKVLRLPDTFPDLNLSHFFWVYVSEGSATLMKSVSKRTQQVIQDKLRKTVSTSLSKKKWNDMEKLLILKENEIYQIDCAIENILETYKFINL